jgi:hypothetical protein
MGMRISQSVCSIHGRLASFLVLGNEADTINLHAEAVGCTRRDGYPQTKEMREAAFSSTYLLKIIC